MNKEKLIKEMQEMGIDVTMESSGIELHRALQNVYIIYMHRIQTVINNENDNK